MTENIYAESAEAAEYYERNPKRSAALDCLMEAMRLCEADDGRDGWVEYMDEDQAKRLRTFAIGLAAYTHAWLLGDDDV